MTAEQCQRGGRGAGRGLRTRAARRLAVALASTGLATLALSSVLASTASADLPRATPVRVHLDYRREPAAATCLSSERLVEAVEARLGRPVFAAASDADLSARLTARRVAGRFVVEVALYDRAQRSLGTRELSTRAPHCSSLDDSVALVLSLAADMPGVVAARDASSPAPAEAEPALIPSPSVRSLETPLSIPESTYAPRLGARLYPTVGVAVASGFLPSPALGLELGLELKVNQLWPVMLRGTGWSEQRQGVPGTPKGATFSAHSLELGLCPWTARLGGSEASVCASQRLGRVVARGFGFAEPQRHDGWQMHAGLGAALKQDFGPLFLAISAGMLVPLVRRRYFFTDGVDVTLFEQRWLSGAVAVRVGGEI